MDKFTPQKVLKLRDELAKKNPALFGQTFSYTEKIDGWYVSVYYDHINKIWHNPLSSAGREIPSLSWLGEYLTNTLYKPNMSMILEAEAWQDMDFAKLNGLLNRSKGDCHFKDIILMCHNLVIFDKPEFTAEKRYSLLQSLFKVSEKVQKSPHLRLLPLLKTEEFNLNSFYSLRDSVIEKGGEGIVGRNISGIYMPGKRNALIIKDKLECTIDAKIINIEEGLGEKGNKSYTIVSERKNGTKIRTVMSRHEDQALYIINPNNFIGKIACIKAMEEYADGQLRQPVFRHIREDKCGNDYD